MRINVTRTSLPPFEEFCEEIRPLWESCRLTNMGPLHERFKIALEECLGCSVTLFSHGHLALEATLELLALKGKKEVITTPFTFVSTVHAIVRKGLTPVFCDVLPSDGTMDPVCLERLVSEDTAAILPVHVYGNPCDVEAIDSVGVRESIPVIYDAAHAFGVKYKGRPLTDWGTASVLSFHASKCFSTVEGGAVCHAPSPSLEQALDDCKNFGIRDEESCVYPGGNAKFNELAAAMGLCNLRHFEEAGKARKAAFDGYSEWLASSHIRILAPREGTEQNHAYLPMLAESAEKRNRLYNILRGKGIGARKYFFPLVSKTACYMDSGLPGSDATPVAEDLSERVLCLPVFPGAPVREIIAALKEARI